MDHTHSSLPALQLRYGPRHRWLVLLAVMVGTMAAVMSSTVVSVALPAIGQRFALGQADLQWINTLFMLSMMVSMLTTPWLLRKIGYRRTYVAMMWLLMAGGLLGGAANHFGVILLARLMEGIAAGVVQPIPAIIVVRAFEPREQGRASGIFGMAVVLAPALGPTIGGLLIESLSWRAIFWMVVPFCIVSIWMAYKLIPSTGPGGVIPGSAPVPMRWLHWPLFKQRVFAAGCVVAFVYGFALYGSTYLLAVYMQTGLQLPPSQVGVVFMPSGLALALTIGFAGVLTGKIAPRTMICGGQVLMTLSFVWMPFMAGAGVLVTLMLLTLLGRLGMGMIAPALNLAAMAHIDKHEVPDAASAINFTRLLGGAVGMFCLGLLIDAAGSLAGASVAQTTRAFVPAFVVLSGVCCMGLVAALQLGRPHKPA